MTKRDIMKVIKAANVNSDIKWEVESTKNNGIIVLTNTYDKAVHFTIKKCGWQDEEMISEWISIRDDMMSENVGALIKGSDRWSDFDEWEAGIEQAVRKTVKYFYYCY